MAKLGTCHLDLIRLVHEVEFTLPPDFDIRVECGHRDKEDQEDAVARGASKVHWPHSYHNSWPSDAVDLTPWPSRWSDVAEQRWLRAFVTAAARRLGLDIEIITWDLPHFQRKRG